VERQDGLEGRRVRERDALGRVGSDADAQAVIFFRANQLIMPLRAQKLKA